MQYVTIEIVGDEGEKAKAFYNLSRINAMVENEKTDDTEERYTVIDYNNGTLHRTKASIDEILSTALEF